MREIIFYTTEAGHCPVEDFLDSLTEKQVDRVIWVFDLVKTQDSVPTKYLKKLVNTDDIWEIRVNSGNNTFRFLGFYDVENLIILTNGFAKKTQKTPSKEIDLAEQRKRDYLSRNND